MSFHGAFYRTVLSHHDSEGFLQKISRCYCMTYFVKMVANQGFATYMMDLALNHVNEERSKIGAQLNRLESVITNNNTSVESTVASRSRIQDADYAQETTTLTKTQIMQQAATAVLAQANTSPQMLMALLK